MTTLYDDEIAYELAEMDRATLLQMAQRRGACVSDIALEVASRAAVARAVYANADFASDLAQSRFGALQDNSMRIAA